jgi:XTP/dITP diphosphohydrolase
MPLILQPGATLVAATHNPGKARELVALLDGRFEILAAGSPGPARAGRDRIHLHRQRPAQGPPRRRSGAAEDRPRRRLRPVGRRPGRLPGHLLRPLGRPGQGLRRRHGQGRGAADRDRLRATARPGSPAPSPSPGPTGPSVVVEGRIDGRLVFPGRGDRGFGYDPIFMSPTATARPSASWTPPRRTPSATAPGRSRPSRPPCFDRPRRRSGSTSTGPTARGSAPTATSTSCATAGRPSRPTWPPPSSADLEAQRALTGPRRLVSVFLGGGTPSLMDPQWAAPTLSLRRPPAVGARRGS